MHAAACEFFPIFYLILKSRNAFQRNIIILVNIEFKTRDIVSK